MDETKDTLNKRWKSSCKTLFGAEAGDLQDFMPWPSGLVERFEGVPADQTVRIAEGRPEWKTRPVGG